MSRPRPPAFQSPERLRALVAQLAAGAGLAAPDGTKEGLHLVQQQIVAAEQAQFEIAAALALGAKVQEDIHFIEVMTCPGGRIAGGGQPLNGDQNAIKARMQALYQIDRDETLRVSHKNEDVARLYKEFLGAPLGEMSHKLLHTHYHKRDVLV